jgi:hypothetical protein
MPSVPKKVEERIREVLKRFSPILISQRDRDVSEADTVTVVKDLLSDLFGYDKYAEVTSEHAIRGTYCDLAIKLDGKLRLLLEVKSIGLQLNEKHIKQAVDYAANQGLDWVVLTNGIRWMLFQISFKKPIEAKMVAEFDLLAVDLKSEADLEKIYLITKEGVLKGAVVEFTEKQSATSKYLIGAVLLNDQDVLNAIRAKEAHRHSSRAERDCGSAAGSNHQARGDGRRRGDPLRAASNQRKSEAEGRNRSGSGDSGRRRKAVFARFRLSQHFISFHPAHEHEST